MSQSDDDDQVGYRRPPKKHQFKPGQSGNPKGRPKKSKNMTTLVDEELDKTVSVIDGGRRRRESKRVLAARQLADRAAKGDHKAIETIMNIERSSEASALSVGANLRPSTTEVTAEQCAAILDDIVRARLEEMKKS